MTKSPHPGRHAHAGITRFGRGLLFVAGGLAALVLLHLALRPWYMNWGATREEVSRALPGDDLAPDSPFIATHAITIQAPPEKVWPWIAQIGRDRAGWYSYTWLENLCLSDSTDSYEVHPEWQTRRPGDNIWLTPPYRYHGDMRFVVYSFQPEHSMVLLYPGEKEQLAERGPPVDNTWSVNLFPQGANASRLIMRSRNRSTGLFMQAFLYFLFEPAHFIMERKMLLTLKELVEKSSSQRWRRGAANGFEPGLPSRSPSAVMSRPRYGTGTKRSRQAVWVALLSQQMPQMRPESMETIQPELTPGESVVWAGQPDPRVIFHRQDVFLIPFSLLWGGFAIFWEAGVSGFWGTAHAARGPSLLMMIWGVPFVLAGQYFIWGRFVYQAWKKKRTHYAVTNRRVIVVQDGWKRQMASAYLDALPTLTKEEGSNGLGTLRFAPAQPAWSGRRGRGWGDWDAMSVGSVPTFVDIEDVQPVYQLVSELREKARTARTAF